MVEIKPRQILHAKDREYFKVLEHLFLILEVTDVISFIVLFSGVE
jgi:hypothetical protein